MARGREEVGLVASAGQKPRDVWTVAVSTWGGRARSLELKHALTQREVVGSVVLYEGQNAL